MCGLGITSCIGQGANETAAAMRCGYNNFQPTDFYIRRSDERLLGAMVAGSIFTGVEHLVELAMEALDGVLGNTKLENSELPLVVLFPTEKETPSSWYEDFYNTFFDLLQKLFSNVTFNQDSNFIRSGKTGFVKGISQAQSLVYDKRYKQVLLLCVDTLLNTHRVSMYENYNDMSRFLTDDNPDGFIPGEAAVAVLLSKPNGTAQTCITGIGFGEEKAVVGSDDVLKAEGMTQAIRNAAKDAGCQVRDTHFVISSVSGESYFFKEVAIARSKSLETKVSSHPLWHPADCIGEVGSAVGGAMILMGHYAFEGNYAPGKRALCLVSNDDKKRGAFILERVGE